MPEITFLKFYCPCGGKPEKIDAIGLTDQHEQIIFLTCPRCGEEICHTADLTELWKSCPPHPIAAPAETDEAFMRKAHIRFEGLA